MQLYTRNGDTGMTDTLNNRIPKSDRLIHLLGTMDEFTSSLGVAKSFDEFDTASCEIVEIQKQLLAVNAQIAGGRQFLDKALIEALEKKIDAYQKVTGSFDGFILQGESTLSSSLDVSRTIIRRAERIAVELDSKGVLDRIVLAYINRLSDFIYSMARYTELVSRIKKTVGNVLAEISEKENENSVRLPSDRLNLDSAKRIAGEIEREAERNGLNAVIAIADEGANLILLNKMDSSFIASIDVAMNKAYTSAALKMTTEEVGRLCREGSSLYGLQYTNNGRIVIFAGGVPLIRNSTVLGGLGVSGGTAEQDKMLAEYGAKVFSSIAPIK
ncbi:MAG: cob(I)yrinic acid a,c-diamide adenosyltransferase [Eubacterium sp.]|jgi:ATP:cob(I)alamin adenosyltransferase|nr:cob(I)yrinic acid a,c-diamide adenosyltransferase [Eubacterium sp.]